MSRLEGALDPVEIARGAAQAPERLFAHAGPAAGRYQEPTLLAFKDDSRG